MSSKVITVRINFEVNTKKGEQQINTLVAQAVLVERILVRTVALVRSMSGDENLNNFLLKVQRAIALVNTLRLTANLLMASNPWLAILGGIGLIQSVGSIGELVGSFGA